MQACTCTIAALVKAQTWRIDTPLRTCWCWYRANYSRLHAYAYQWECHGFSAYLSLCDAGIDTPSNELRLKCTPEMRDWLPTRSSHGKLTCDYVIIRPSMRKILLHNSWATGTHGQCVSSCITCVEIRESSRSKWNLLNVWIVWACGWNVTYLTQYGNNMFYHPNS